MTISRRDFLKAASAAMAMPAIAPSLSANPGGGPGRADKPNVIFVFADQLRACSVGCMGNPEVKTPFIDQMAKDGLLIENGIASQPVCTPYRAQLMTGRYGHTTGVVHNDIRLPDDEQVISEQFKQRGYTTGYIGKWHLSGSRKDPVDKISKRGWDFWAVRNCSHAHSKPVYWLNDAKEPIKVPGWEPDVQTDVAIEFIKQRKDQPFSLFVSFGPPHNPYKAPKRYADQYQPDALTPRPNTPKVNKKNYQHYYAMTTNLDDCMKRISDALEEAGIADNTILIFTSDHGDMLGSQGQQLKQRPWEESIHVPLVIRYPNKIKAGQRKDWIVSSVDLMPTMLGLCGAQIPAGVQGMDYSKTFVGESDQEREDAFLFNIDREGKPAGSGSDWRGLRTKEWTYAYHLEGDWVLYDNKNDPYQLKNLIDDPAYAQQKAALKQRVNQQRKELGDNLTLKGKLPKPIVLPN